MTRTSGSPAYGSIPGLHDVTHALPPHLGEWELPPGWSWGAEGVRGEHRHYQEIIDALGRSLSLVSAPDPAHHQWLGAEARHLAHRNHAAVPTTYHYWIRDPAGRRGPGYLRRWIAGETVGSRLRRAGADDVPAMLRVLREVGSALSYLHDMGTVHGAVSADNVWTLPMGRIWLLGWQWALPAADIPPGLTPDFQWMAAAPEWENGRWVPSAASDQWQLAALCFSALTGELPPSREVPPIRLLRPECPQSLAAVIDRALSLDPAERFTSVTSMLRAVDRIVGGRITPVGTESVGPRGASEEARLRWALAEDYEVLDRLGDGSFGSVWRVRDLSLGREVALKLLHQHVARDERAVGRFRREARLAAQLAHPAIVPIYDWDSRGDLLWYTMELEEYGSVADFVERSGPRPLSEIAPQVDLVLGGLAAAHANGIVHRDLKPENILIDRYRRWRVTDFGIANIAGEDRSGTTGTPAFAAPEQLLGELQDPSADCFSLAGIVLYTLSGEPPFGEAEGQLILSRQLSRQVDLSPYPAAVGAWLHRALNPQPEERFADASAMQRAWRDAIESEFAGDARRPWWRRWFNAGAGEQLWTVDASS